MPVTVYSMPSCPQCVATKRALDRKGVDYNEVDLTLDPTASALVRDLGYRSAPVVIAGESHWYGFRPDMIGTLQAAA